MKRRQNPQRLIPVEGYIYENAGGGRYLCEAVYEIPGDARMTNIVSGWTMLVHGLVQYDDGTIEWDSSHHGFFGKVPETKRAELRQRQISLMNAMLCCAI